MTLINLTKKVMSANQVLVAQPLTFFAEFEKESVVAYLNALTKKHGELSIDTEINAKYYNYVVWTEDTGNLCEIRIFKNK